MTLRARLLAGLLALSLAAVVAIGGGTYLQLRSFLLHRVDLQLSHARRAVLRVLASPHGSAAGTISARQLRDLAPPETFLELRDQANNVETSVLAGPIAQPTPAPRLAAVLDPPAASASFVAPPSDLLRFETRAVMGSVRYRVQVGWLSGGRRILIVGAPLDSVSATLSQLLVVELIIAGVVLSLLGLGAFWLLRGGLRPLERMARTAAGIAEGDLDVRVAPADGDTEVGRLGLALNGMLGRLQEAFVRRDRSEAELRRFVSGASHELRTPLTSILGYAALFRRGASRRPSDLATSIGRIESEATRMSGLIDDLLLLARLDERRPLEHEHVDLARVALDAARDARARDPQRPISVDSPESVVVFGDEPRLRQVAANLLVNAEVHTPPGTPVHVEVATSGEQGALVVTDEGPGVDPEDAPHIFERFYRGTPLEAPNGPKSPAGSGLGLAIVAAIAQSHRGSISLRSRPGQGARFELTLPLAAADADPRKQEPSVRPLEGSTGTLAR
jgi:two-component system, OmpR family, sensor kinase